MSDDESSDLSADMQVAFHQNSQLTAAAPHLHRATNDSKPAVKEARQEIDNVRRPTAMAGIRSASVCLCKNRFFDINVDISPAPRIVTLEEKWRE